MVHNLVRRVATVMISLVAVVALSIPGVNYALASTVLMMGGTTFPTLSDETMAAVLNGRYANDTRVNVEWPAQMWPQTGLTSLTLGESVAIGIENLQDAVPTASRPTVVLGMSGSAPVVDEVQRRLAADPNAPKSDQLSFVTLADPNRGHGILTLFRNVPVPILNYTPTPEPVTQYNNLVVVKEYDGYADFPDRPWNLLATLNAIVGMGIIPGFGSMHYDTIFSDLATVPKENITTTVNAKGGVTTTYLVPSPDLPLLQPLRDWGCRRSSSTPSIRR